jgi:hypothetical protein
MMLFVVALLDVSDALIHERNKLSQFDPLSGTTYFNEQQIPKSPSVRTRLSRRSRDSPEAIGNRVKLYRQNVHEATLPFKPILRNFLCTSETYDTPDTVVADILKFVATKPGPDQVTPRLFKVFIVGPKTALINTLCHQIAGRFGFVYGMEPSGHMDPIFPD